ncbi:MAG: hypothetical protein WCP53_00290 [Verrucomicrobiota bacterium]
MPPPNWRRTRRQPRPPALALSSRTRSRTRSRTYRHSGPSLDRSAYIFDSDEDYDSDMCADWALPARVSSKVRSALHAAWVALEDAEGNFPRDDSHDLTTVAPHAHTHMLTRTLTAHTQVDATLDDLAEFLTEMEEALNWFRAVVNAPDAESDAATLVRMHSALRVEKPDEPAPRPIGPRVLLETNLVALSFTALFRECEPAQLAASLRVRRVRTSLDPALREARMAPSEPTSGEALVCRAERLQAAVDAALAQCDAQAPA